VGRDQLTALVFFLVIGQQRRDCHYRLARTATATTPTEKSRSAGRSFQLTHSRSHIQRWWRKQSGRVRRERKRVGSRNDFFWRGTVHGRPSPAKHRPKLHTTRVFRRREPYGHQLSYSRYWVHATTQRLYLPSLGWAHADCQPTGTWIVFPSTILKTLHPSISPFTSRFHDWPLSTPKYPLAILQRRCSTRRSSARQSQHTSILCCCGPQHFKTQRKISRPATAAISSWEQVGSHIVVPFGSRIRSSTTANSKHSSNSTCNNIP
jgi:hypothetical protein